MRTVIVPFLLGCLLLSEAFAQDFVAQWHLPMGAKARLGRGRLKNIRLSPDGTRVVASTAIGVWIYDAETGDVVSLFTEKQTGEQDAPIRMVSPKTPEALTFATDASIIATAHGDSVYIWDTFTGAAFAELTGHPDSITALALSADNTKLATAGGDWAVRVWEVGTGRYIRNISHPSAVNAVAFSPDGQTLATAGAMLRLWDIETGEQRSDDSEDLGSVDVLVFSADSKFLATGGGFDTKVRLWDVRTGKLHQTLAGHTDKIQDIAFSPDNSMLVTTGDDRMMRLWDVNTGESLKRLPTPDDKLELFRAVERWHHLFEQGVTPASRDEVQSVRFTADGSRLVTVSKDGSLHLWDVATGLYQHSFSLGEHTDSLNLLTFSADGKYLVSNNALTAIARVWSLETFTQHRILTPAQQVLGLIFSPDIRRLLGRRFDRTIRVWDAETKTEVAILEGADKRGGYWHFRFSPDSKTIVGKLLRSGPPTHGIGRQIYGVELWAAETGAHLFKLTGHRAVVDEYSFSPDSTQIATADRDGNIILWDVETGQQLRTFTGDTEAIRTLFFDPTGETLFSGSAKALWRWNTATGELLKLLELEEEVNALTVSPDGNRLAIGSRTGRIQVWQIGPVYTLESVLNGHQEPVYVLQFSPDGKTLASGSGDGTILLWDTETPPVH